MAHIGIGASRSSIFHRVCLRGHSVSYICNTHLREYARLYPHDGQDGLAAGVEGLLGGALTFVLVFGIAFLAQRLWQSDR